MAPKDELGANDRMNSKTTEKRMYSPQRLPINTALTLLSQNRHHGGNNIRGAIMHKVVRIAAAALFLACGAAQTQSKAQTPEKIIIDSDIGDDIDDAFALGLALSSPEFD